jgi:hypothetical protein
MKRKCEVCGVTYEAKHPRAKYCTTRCRVRNSRGAAKPSTDKNPLVAAITRELEAAGKLDTMLGQTALALGARMSGTDTGAGVASLARELRSVMVAAVGSSPSAGSSAGRDDGVDELRARRDKKRAG